jgi:hypothetical protein
LNHSLKFWNLLLDQLVQTEENEKMHQNAHYNLTALAQSQICEETEIDSKKRVRLRLFWRNTGEHFASSGWASEDSKCNSTHEKDL